MKVRFLPVDKIGIWPPDPIQKLPVEYKLINIGAVKHQPLISPVLPDV